MHQLQDGAWAQSLVTTGALTILIMIERIVPFFVGRGSGAHDARNVTLGVIGGLARAVWYPALLLLVCEAAALRRWGLLHQFDLDPWLSLADGVLLLDAWAYLWHILSHKVPVLWRFHTVHHHDTEVDASTALRFHAGDVLVSAVATLALIPLAGLSLHHILAYELIVLPMSMFHHANIRVPERLDRVLRLVVVTPRMHLVHHSTWQPETDSNYSAVFSIWDRLFGTLRLRRDPGSIRLGLEGYEEPDHSTLRGCLLTPLGTIKSLPGSPTPDPAPRTLGPCATPRPNEPLLY